MNDKPSLMPTIIIALVLTLAFSATAEAQPNLGTSIMDNFVSRTTSWWSVLRNYALYVFKLTVTLEVCLFGIRMVLQKSQINEIAGQFMLLLLFVCFIAAVIMNYKEWAEAVAIKGLKPIANDLGTGVNYDAGQPVAMIFACLEAMVPVLGDASVWDFGMVMIYVFCMGSIIAVFAVICCRYIIVICEFYIVANAGILLIGLGGSQLFKEYAINVMRYILSVGVKLFVLQLVINIGFSILSLSSIEALQGQSISNISLYDLVAIVVQGAILLGLAMTLPSTCAGIISGSSVDAGNPLRMVSGAVAGKGLAMLGNAGKSLASGAQNLKMANQIAKQEGVKGFGNRATHMYQTLRNANMAANPGLVQNQLKSQLNAGKALSHLDRPTAGPSSSARPKGLPSGDKGAADMTRPPKLN